MAEERVQRRLAAVLSADVVGYSRLVEADEAGTVARLKTLQCELIRPRIAEDGGRIVKLMGDGVLAEFGSAVDAVRSALSLQAEFDRHNAELTERDRIEFRVGINVGDVIIDDDDIHGDCVNVADRLQGLCAPGAVFVSGSVYEQVAGKLDVRFEDLGEQKIKNIARPIRVYSVHTQAIAARESAVRTSSLPLPDKPSIAILPFANMSGDPEQEYFADGMVDEIITQLSRFPDLFVIARNSSFTYKGRAVRVQDVGRVLGVAHIVEGSVRKAGHRVRISVQLIDAATGSHIWVERYDRELIDIFDLQDEIAEAIVGVLPGRIELATAERLKRKPISDMAAYDCVLAGKIHHDRVTPEDNIEALRLLDKAIALAPDYATAWAWKACTLGQAATLGYVEDPEAVYRQAVEAISRALRLDEHDVNCHRLLCEVNMEEHRLDRAQHHHDKAYKMNPNDVLIVAQRGELLTWQGRHEEGAQWVEKAMRLDPFAAHRRAHLLGRARHAARRYAEALDAFRSIPSPRYPSLADMAGCHARLDEAAKAELCAAEVSRLKPDFSAEAYVAKLPYHDPDDRAHHLEGLRQAGLPA